MNIEADAIEDFELFVAFDAFKSIKDSLLETPSSFSGKLEAFVKMLDGNNDRVVTVVWCGFGCISGFLLCH